MWCRIRSIHLFFGALTFLVGAVLTEVIRPAALVDKPETSRTHVGETSRKNCLPELPPYPIREDRLLERIARINTEILKIEEDLIQLGRKPPAPGDDLERRTKELQHELELRTKLLQLSALREALLQTLNRGETTKLVQREVCYEY